MFNWFKKEAPLKALAGMGGGVGRGGSGSVNVEIHMYGGKSNEGGRGGSSPYGGWTTISGTATSGTTIAYICGRSAGGQAFYDGGPGSGNGGRTGGGFTAVWVGGSNIEPVARDSNYILGVAGASGAGGNDGYGDCRGGYGGGPVGGECPESPDQNLGGGGGTQSGGGSGGGGAPWGGQWYGGNGHPSPDQNVGGGGGGWWGGGGGGSNNSFDAGGGGGSGYTGSTPRTLENPYGTFEVTGGQTSAGGYPGPGAPGPVGSAYPHTGNHPAEVGRVYIIVDGVEVHDGTASPGSAAATFTIP